MPNGSLIQLASRGPQNTELQLRNVAHEYYIYMNPKDYN